MRAAGRFNLERVETLVHEALQRPPQDREAFLETSCAGDADLRREVASLLEHAEEADSQFTGLDSSWPLHLKRGARGASAASGERGDSEGAQRDSQIGQTVGRYRLVERIGAGGMGNVYRAVRDDREFEQTVAVKLIRPGLDTEDILTRFRRERQVLAALNHPNIARLLDGGSTPVGRPYLVMEHVDGERITTWCDAERLGVRQRVELFRKVCDAVQYAHQNLVVHRDLKPGNILVTGSDARWSPASATPKLLDFGIARVLEADDEAPADHTKDSSRVLTAAYASPEQLRGEPVNTATDIYSLGVVLYELIVGRLPYAPDRTDREELAQAVLTAPPLRPADALTDRTAADDVASLARARSTDVAKLSRDLAGDLEQILLTALHKEPQRRYATAAALSDDLKRWLDGMPVAAKPDSLGYRTRKFIARHRTAVAAGAACALALMAATAISASLLIETRRAREAAEMETRTTATINEFLNSMLSSVDPRVEGIDVTVREVLDNAASRAERELAAHAAVERGVQGSIGRAYLALGLYDEAYHHLDRALTVSGELYGEDDPRTTDSRHDLGLALRQLGRYREAESLHRISLEHDRKRFGEDSLQAARSMNDLAQSLYDQGRFEEGRPLFIRALEIRSEQPDAADIELITSLSNMARTSVADGNYQEAETYLREALELYGALYGDDHPETIGGMNNVAFILMMGGEFDEAERMFEQTVEGYRSIYGDSHPDLARALNNLGECIRRRGRHSDAAEVHREALAMRRATLGDHHPLTAVSLNNLALALSSLEQYDEAILLQEESLAIRRAELGEDHPNVAAALNNLGHTQYRLGNLDEAQQLQQQALELRRASFGDRHPQTANSQMNLARTLNAQGDRAQAESLCREALSTQAEMLGDDHPDTLATRALLGRVLTALHRFEEAERELTAAYAGLLERLGESSPQVEGVRSDLAELYDAWNRPDDAARWREE